MFAMSFIFVAEMATVDEQAGMRQNPGKLAGFLFALMSR